MLILFSFLVSIAGAILADKIGRRALWMTSFISMILANIGTVVSSALVAKDADNKAAAYLVIVFLFLYNAGFNVACNPLAYAYPTELLPYAMRTKGMSVFVLVGQALLIVNQVSCCCAAQIQDKADLCAVRQSDRHRPDWLALLAVLPRHVVSWSCDDLFHVTRDTRPHIGADCNLV